MEKPENLIPIINGQISKTKALLKMIEIIGSKSSTGKFENFFGFFQRVCLFDAVTIEMCKLFYLPKNKKPNNESNKDVTIILITEELKDEKLKLEVEQFWEKTYNYIDDENIKYFRNKQ